MRKIVGFLGVIVLAVAAMHAQDKAAGKMDDSTEKMLIANEHSLYEAVAKTGQPLAATTLASTLWRERGDKWLAVHHQETDLTQQ